MRKLIAASIQNPVFVNLLMLIIICTGVFASLTMRREILPTVKVDMVQVMVPYPGAGPEEVEEGISRKLEEAVEGLEGIKRYITTAAEGMGTAIVEIEDDYDLQKVKDEITDNVNAITTFPEDAERPIISEVPLREDVIRVMVYGDLNERQLKEVAEDVKDQIIALPNVSQVGLMGTRPYEISIEVSEEKLRQYGITFDQVSDAVRRASLNLPGGTLRSRNEEIKIRTMGRRYTGEEFASIVALAAPDGTVIRLDEVATIRDEFEEEPIVSHYFSREVGGGIDSSMPAVLLTVFKTESEDSMLISKEVLAFIEDYNKQMPPNVRLGYWLDASVFIKERMDMMVKNGLFGLVLVFFTLWFFLDLRLSFWVALGIPISLAGAMALGSAIGVTINMITLFALIMMLGIIVDDAIIAGESIYYHRKRGEPPRQAAIIGATEVAWPVTAAITTTIIAFAPLLFIGGIMGQIIEAMPMIVIAALIISLIESLIILPTHLRHLPEIISDPAKAKGWKRRQIRLRHKLSRILEVVAERLYLPFIRKVLNWRYVTFACAVALFLVTAGLFQGGFIKYNMFPSIDGDYLEVKVEFPEGTPLNVTDEALLRIEEAFKQVDEEMVPEAGEEVDIIRNIYSVAGAQFSGIEMMFGSNVGWMIAELLPTEKRGIRDQDIAARVQDMVGPLPGALSFTVEAPSMGPPGQAIELWVRGNDIDMLRGIADTIKEELAKKEGVYDVEDDFRPGKRELRVHLKPEARTLGLTTADVARQLRQGFYGDESLRVQRGRDEVKVKVRYPIEERRGLGDVEDVRIRTAMGEEVPLEAVANVTLEQGYSAIKREDGKRRIVVTADIQESVANAQEILGVLETDLLAELRQKYPTVEISVEGKQQSNAEAMGSLKVGFPLALMGIYLILATIFRSYYQPVIIMIAIPFGLIGAAFGHLIMGYEVTMLSMFGMVALSGIVVNDSIVLIEHVNSRVHNGEPLLEALANGGARRFRAIFLTSVTTFAGLSPLMFEKSMQAQFLIPMAISITFGVAFATVITLVLIPCLVAILNDTQRLLHFLWKGHMPAREEVDTSFHSRDPLGEIPGSEA